MLSINEKKVYIYLVGYTNDHLYPPTLDEICEGTGLKSKSTVSNTLKSLSDLGYIRLKNNSPRAIGLVGYEFTRKKES